MFRQTHISHHTFGDCLMRYRNIVSRSDLNHWKNNWENRRWQIITGNITGGWYRWCLSGVLLVWYRDRVVPKRETRGDNQRPLGSELCWAWVFANSLFHGVVARLDPTALAEYWANYDTLQILITKIILEYMSNGVTYIGQECVFFFCLGKGFGYWEAPG